MVVQRAHPESIRGGTGFQSAHFYGITFQIPFFNQRTECRIATLNSLKQLGATHLGQQLRIAQA